MGDLYNPFPKLPKNIRQVGERDQTVRLYLEDYVNTYLKRLFPKGGQDLRAGVLLGTAEDRDGMPYLFVDGALEMEDVTENGEKVQFTEPAWKKTYQTMEQMFPKREILGWFLCGAPGSTLNPVNYWKAHGSYFAGKNQLMYLNSGLDGEEAVYVAAEDGFLKLRGYSVYYERNQMMQDYMILRKDVRRVESGAGDTVIRDFRQRMEDNKTQAVARQGTVRVLGGLCAALGILVLAGGVTIMSNYEKMKDMEAVLASVLPAGFLEGGAQENGTDKLAGDGQRELAGGSSQVVVEDIDGQLHMSPDWTGSYEDPVFSNEEAQDDGSASAGSGAAAGADGGPALASGGGAGAGGTGGGSAETGGDGTTTAGSGGMSIQTSGSGGSGQTSGGDGTAAADGSSSTSDQAGGSGGSGQTSGGDGTTAAGGSSSTSDQAGGSSASGSSGQTSGNSTGSASGRDSGNGAAREAAAGQRMYLVQPGDTLYGICLDVYGNGSRMDEICLLNGLESPDKIDAGQNLILP